jgi:hypothetical protein
MEKLLRGLTAEQLEKAKEVAEFLLANVQSHSTKSIKTTNEIV